MDERFGHIEGVVQIGTDLYVKTPAALDALLATLGQQYNIKDCGKSTHSPAPGSWYASVREDVVARRAKCGACNALIDRLGLEVHRHRCEVCGAFTFLQFVDGTVIRFAFRSKGPRDEHALLRMQVCEYDDASGCLLLDAAPIAGNGFNDLRADEAGEVLAHHESEFTRCKKDGRDLIAIRHNPYPNRDQKDEIIGLYEVLGSRRNFTLVKVYQGKEYGEYDALPIAEDHAIYEAWHWAPLKRTPRLHEEIIGAARMVSDCGYYYQDGRPVFFDAHLARMRTFVEHFTDLDLGAWDAMIVRADRSGPGMIRAVAAFCHPQAEVENRPNFGNVLVGLGKMLEGQTPTDGEVAAMADALKDPVVSEEFGSMFKTRRRGTSR